MARVSVLIPARNEPYLRRTVEGVLANASGDVECIVLLDGAPAVEPLPDDPRLTVLTNDKAAGIGAATWRMAHEATGEWLMKLDAHCLLGEGYDLEMQSRLDGDWLGIPARYQLRDDDWSRGYGPIHYLYLTYPFLQEPQFGWGAHGKKWVGPDGLAGRYFWPEKAWKDRQPVDDIMAFQGSCWFMRRDRFLDLGGIDARYWLWQEALTLCLKAWLSGGRVVRVKTAWYAHLHKGKRHGRGYFIHKSWGTEANRHSADFWLHDRWQHPLRTRPFRWYVEHFWPIPGWPADWDDPKYEAAVVWPERRKKR